MQQISESVQSMRNIVHDDSTISGQTFSLARPIPAFASNALLPMDFIIKLKQNPPNRISLIHAVILSNEKLVMAKSSEIQLRQSSIPFEKFKTKFLHQQVTVTQTIDTGLTLTDMLVVLEWSGFKFRRFVRCFGVQNNNNSSKQSLSSLCETTTTTTFVVSLCWL